MFRYFSIVRMLYAQTWAGLTHTQLIWSFWGLLFPWEDFLFVYILQYFTCENLCIHCEESVIIEILLQIQKKFKFPSQGDLCFEKNPLGKKEWILLVMESVCLESLQSLLLQPFIWFAVGFYSDFFCQRMKLSMKSFIRKYNETQLAGFLLAKLFELLPWNYEDWQN